MSTAATETPRVAWAIADGIGVLRLQRPPANAIDAGLLADLVAGLDALEAAGVEGAILAGRQGLFSAGLDLPALLQLDAAGMAAFWRAFCAAFLRLYCSPICFVAAIDGHAPAGGTVLALTADHRLMSRGPYRIGLNEVAVGLAVPGYLCRLAAALLGQREAERLLTQGALLEPEAALRAGFVDGLVDEGPADAAGLRPVEAAARAELARRLALPQRARRVTKQKLRAPLAAAIEAEIDAEVEGFLDAWFEPTCQATLRAVVERLAQGRGRG